MIRVADFDLQLTVMSGQPLAFHSDCSFGNVQNTVSYVTSSGAISVKHTGTSLSGALEYSYGGEYTDESARAEITRRFGLDHDMSSIYARIGTDDLMKEAVSQLHGMRITRNDPWETLLCFIVSQFNNIKRIRNTTRMLISRFGEGIDTASGKRFPGPERFANASLSSIRACGTGFRDVYIKKAAKACSMDFDLSELGSYPYAEAKARLMGLPGVGDKVADCVLLFGYGKLEAFPIDTWVKKTVESLYFKGSNMPVRKIHEFAYEQWGDMRGYAQQYLFWHGRESGFGGRLDA